MIELREQPYDSDVGIALSTSTGWNLIEPYGLYKDPPRSVCFAKELRGR